MPSGLLMIFLIGSSVTLGIFQAGCWNVVSKGVFVHLGWRILVWFVPSSLHIYCLPCYPRLSILMSYWSGLECIVCYFRHALFSSIWAFLSFWALASSRLSSFLNCSCLPGNSMFFSQFGWYAFRCRFRVGIAEVLIFVIRGQCFQYLLKCIEFVS